MTTITRNLPWLVRDLGVSIIGQECYTSLVENLALTDVQCLKYALSKGLGVGIVIGGSIMKVPQLLLILRAHSARGLSLTAVCLRNTCLLHKPLLFVSKRVPFLNIRREPVFNSSKRTHYLSYRLLLPSVTQAQRQPRNRIPRDASYRGITGHCPRRNPILPATFYSSIVYLLQAAANTAELPRSVNRATFRIRSLVTDHRMLGEVVYDTAGSGGLASFRQLPSGVGVERNPWFSVMDILGKNGSRGEGF
ncbi:uncharacterized protein EV420DRAFT_1640249 [Desarmillaria tabescens]|uniref:Uncharacterized protein n=1 Tax=Armillaria tabescens TaxID=1929756 RepID=A0AA39NAB3_ARMTA|nr:uncharacterized protein EV420DRAFT_1640249 [Desarmillaria tabescens]KAK0461950.1 hypothetical protein EV420DRAFT_1640249 [Desarmillaria tabescens]